MISGKLFKKMVWTNILIADTRGDLADEIKKFQIDNPTIKITDIQYNHAMYVNNNGNYATVVNKFSAMIIYK
jgi:hypothetical protein